MGETSVRQRGSQLKARVGRLKFPKAWTSPWKRYALAAGCLAICILLRFALARFLYPGDPGLFLFIPALIVVVALGGLGASVALAVLSSLSVWYFFLVPHYSFLLTSTGAFRLVTFIFIMSITLALTQWLKASVAEIENEKEMLMEAAQREKMLTRELQHRSQNLFAIIHNLALRTLDDNGSRHAFLGRLDALARADQRLFDTASKGTLISYLIKAALDPFAGRFTAEGEDILLDSKIAQNFSLVLHELATNASKYGALSTTNGTVDLSWKLAGNGNRKMNFIWKETGGPPVTPPTRRGLGTSLIKSALGPSRLRYRPEGLFYEAEVTLPQPSATSELGNDIA